MDGTDTATSTATAVEQPNIVSFIATGMVRGLLPLSPIVGPVTTYYVKDLGTFELAPTSSPHVVRLTQPKTYHFTIAAIMAPGEDGTVSLSAFAQQAKAGKLRFRYVKLTQKLKSRFEEAESLCDLQSASPEHMYLKGEDVSRPSGDGRTIEFVELSYGGILSVETRGVVPALRKQVASYGWEPCPFLTMTIEEVVDRVQAMNGEVKGWNGEGFDAAAESIGD